MSVGMLRMTGEGILDQLFGLSLFYLAVLHNSNECNKKRLIVYILSQVLLLFTHLYMFLASVIINGITHMIMKRKLAFLIDLGTLLMFLILVLPVIEHHVESFQINNEILAKNPENIPAIKTLIFYSGGIHMLISAIIGLSVLTYKLLNLSNKDELTMSLLFYGYMLIVVYMFPILGLP
jgi:hypothetical protein